MNTTAEKNVNTSPENETASIIDIENTKHQKKQRAFPSLDEIKIGDRFTIPSGNSCWSNTLEAAIMLPGNTKVEIVGYKNAYGVDNENESPHLAENDFKIVKLVRSNDEWVRDEKLGALGVRYTALANWHYRNEK